MFPDRIPNWKRLPERRRADGRKVYKRNERSYGNAARLMFHLTARHRSVGGGGGGGGGDENPSEESSAAVSSSLSSFLFDPLTEHFLLHVTMLLGKPYYT